MKQHHNSHIEVVSPSEGRKEGILHLPAHKVNGFVPSAMVTIREAAELPQNLQPWLLRCVNSPPPPPPPPALLPNSTAALVCVELHKHKSLRNATLFRDDRRVRLAHCITCGTTVVNFLRLRLEVWDEENLTAIWLEHVWLSNKVLSTAERQTESCSPRRSWPG